MRGGVVLGNEEKPAGSSVWQHSHCARRKRVKSLQDSLMASTARLRLLRGLHCAGLDTSHIPQTLIILLVFTAVLHKYFMSILFASLSFGFAQ